jgi:hypothetical protein
LVSDIPAGLGTGKSSTFFYSVDGKPHKRRILAGTKKINKREYRGLNEKLNV